MTARLVTIIDKLGFQRWCRLVKTSIWLLRCDEERQNRGNKFTKSCWVDWREYHIVQSDNILGW